MQLNVLNEAKDSKIVEGIEIKLTLINVLNRFYRSAFRKDQCCYKLAKYNIVKFRFSF